MSTTRIRQDRYALGRTGEEYQRLRAQARVWEVATGRLLDRVGLAEGARCLDAGCGPGEAMRLMAERVGPRGRITGVDVDAPLGETAVRMLHEAGHRQCSFAVHDLTGDAPIPHGPFDLVYARLLLFHLPQRDEVLRRLWDAVAPGGHLVIQDYDLRSVAALPTLPSVEEAVRIMNSTFQAFGCDVHAGTRAAELFARVGIGAPDGTDVAGRVEPLATGRVVLEQTVRSLLPGAVARGLMTEPQGAAALAAIGGDAERFGERPLLWPLLVGTWKRKAAA
jgi:2-polyprenyl-3-methyl-5-hydroxy-6-metoxy-1,4-benzoquinol methylase